MDVRVCVPEAEGSDALGQCTDALSNYNTNDLKFECTAGGVNSEGGEEECLWRVRQGVDHVTYVGGMSR